MSEVSNPEELTGKALSAISEVLDGDGQVSALQFTLADGGSVIMTDWTDWTLRIDRRAESGMPDYFWPAEEYTVRSIPALAGVQSITGVEDVCYEAGDLVGVCLSIAEVGVLSVSAHAGRFSWELEDRR